MSYVKQLTHNLPTPVVSPTTIGKVAAQILRSASTFAIRGITSRGIFTLIDDRKIVFLSREAYKGPLIVNLPWVELRLDQISLTSHGRIANRCFLFSDLDLVIDCADAEIWSALSIWHPAALSQKLPTDETLIDFLDRLLKKSENELILAVHNLISGSEPPPPNQENEVETEVRKLSAALHTGDFDMVTQGAHFFAGRGRGLTPSGDDFLLGIVYALYSLKDRMPSAQIASIPLIANMVNRRSTLISANLVDCAGAGEVDERIGKAFYALLSPSWPIDQAVEDLATWGSSSGFDTAAGIVLLLNILK